MIRDRADKTPKNSTNSPEITVNLENLAGQNEIKAKKSAIAIQKL